MRSVLKSVLLLLATLGPVSAASADTASMVVTLLGTGTPDPRPDRFGNSTLVQAGGKNLVFDAGRGASIRLEQIGSGLGNITAVFLTHYHSDHTNGLPDLWLTGWLPPHGARKTPLNIYGPTGVNELVEGLQRAYKADIDIRLVDEKLPPAGIGLVPHQFDKPAVVFDEDGVKVEAFKVDHGEFIQPSYGYKVSYGDHSVVISGDTRKSDNVIQAAKGADLLLHEVAIAGEDIRHLPAIKRIMDHHTSPEEAGEVFAASRPKLAVYTHLVLLKDSKGVRPGEAQLIAETRKTYGGPLEVGEDLMRFVIGDRVQVVRFDPATVRYPTKAD